MVLLINAFLDHMLDALVEMDPNSDEFAVHVNRCQMYINCHFTEEMNSYWNWQDLLRYAVKASLQQK